MAWGTRAEEVLDHVVRNLFPSGEGGSAVCLYNANPEFWAMLADVAQAHGTEVRLVPISSAEASDPLWVPEASDERTCLSSVAGKYQSDCTIIGMPLYPMAPAVEEQTYRRLAKLARSAHCTICWEWPLHQIPITVRDTVEGIYLDALFIDYHRLARKNGELVSRFPREGEIRVKADNRTDITLSCQPENVYSENCHFGGEETCFQLPGGEVFAIPDAGTAEGSIGMEINREAYKVTISKGVADFSEIASICAVPKEAPLSEFGIGTNWHVPGLKMLSIGEKAAGTCHFGFGDNYQLGGSLELGYHFDLLVQEPHIAWIPVNA